MEKKIVGVIGGMLGDDPFSERAWSGSSKRFFEACDKIGILKRAFGVSIKNTLDYYYLAASNFSFDKRKWIGKFYLDPRHNLALTKKIADKICPEDMEGAFVQIGSIYDVPSVINGKTSCFLYADANVAQFMKSPYCAPDMQEYAKKAFLWEKNVHEKLDHIFTFSEYVRKSFIEDFGITPARVTKIGVGMNWDVPSDLNKDYSKKEIVFIGKDFIGKGGDVLLKAFRRVKEKHKDSLLHILGPRNAPANIHQNGVIFHGFLSQNNLSQQKKFLEIMNSCTLGVLPSRWDAFGISVLEFMAYGMPSIATNRWAFPEMITPGTSGELIDVDDVDDLTDKILYYFDDISLRKEHGFNAREYVIRNYGWDIVAKNIEKEL